MVAGPGKEILGGREFARGDIWRKMRARKAGHLKGIHRRGGMSVGGQESFPSEEVRAGLEVSLEV